MGKRPVTPEVVNSQLLRLMVSENIPFNFVQSPAVRSFFRQITNCELQDRKTFARQLPSLYAPIKDVVLHLLRAAKFASIQFDFWSCKSSGKQFGALIARVPSSDNSLQHILLGLVPLSKSHTADNIAEWAKGVLGSFGIILAQHSVSPIISIATIDMAANGRAAAERLRLLYMPCFAHQLNLVLQHAITEVNEVKQLLTSLSRLTKLLRKSPILSEKLRLLVSEPALSAEVAAVLKHWKPDRNLTKQLPVSLIKPVKTRWSSYVKALRRLLVLWKPVWRLQEVDEWKKAWNRVLFHDNTIHYININFFFYF
ncbi:MAG: hypothetical protein H0W74_14390 [Sphingosinicella sp.]|nr:hypothetical protein [Sphingosinicella sp.]